MNKRKVNPFLNRAEIEKAILQIEETTSARIVVSLAPYFWGSVRRNAERAFRRHRLFATTERNAVFFFIVPSRREFILLADIGVHAKLGQQMWDSVATDVQTAFRESNSTVGLMNGIRKIGQSLAHNYPARLS